MPQNREKLLEQVSQVIDTVHRLRAPGGCPWDQEQTHQSLRPFLIEEAYEVLDVLDQIEDVSALQEQSLALREELGDLFLQILLHSEMADQEQAFDFGEVAQALNEKLIRRHPHVFGDQKASSADSAFQNWEKQKAMEKKDQPRNSVLDGLPRQLPALQKSSRTIEKVSRVGFQWSTLEGPQEKLQEELQELSEAIESQDTGRITDELGDVLFCLSNIAFHLKVNPEDALRKTLEKFERRFRFVETRLKEKGSSPEQSTLQEMDTFWEEAKKHEPKN